MPRRCCVPGCRSNYKGEPYTNVYSFPKDHVRKSKWLRQIHRENFVATNSSVVCIKHFDENFIERDHKATRSDGTFLIVPRSYPVLTHDAYPSIFAEQPAYMTAKPIVKRKTPSERLSEAVNRSEREYQEWTQKSIIKDFNEFKCHYKYKLPENWTILPSENCIYFAKVIFAPHPHLLVSVKVCSELKVSVWHNSNPVPNSKLTWLLGSELKLKLWTTYECLLSHLNGYSFESSFGTKLNCILYLLTECAEECDNELKEKLQFLKEQTSLLTMVSPRYSPDLLLWSAKLYFSFPGGYKLLRDTAKLILPHPYYLKSLLQNLGCIQSGIQSSCSQYLSRKILELSERDKIVGLLMDEIYVKSGVNYKGGRVEGMAENAANTEASTLQVFMISSVFSKNKDVVGLFPMKNQNADDLLCVLLEVLEILKTAGYRVLFIVSDNNRVNRKCYEILSGGNLKSKIQNPKNSSEEIFLLFDTVHIIKCIRNNWINQRASNQTFFIPPMISLPTGSSTQHHSDNKVMYASVTHLKCLYEQESQNTVKLAPSLTRKALFPNRLELQCVGQALRLFDDKLIPALESSKDIIGKDVIGTLHFVDIVSKWWKIVNVKTPHKGKHKRDIYCDPIRNSECLNLAFLESFCKWLNDWDSLPVPEFEKPGSRCGKLSKETYVALRHTTETLIVLCKYLFNCIDPCPDYILLGKFQTDSLEARFGQYRTMSGGNYNVSVVQILESERKLKILSLMTLQSARLGTFSIKSFMADCKDNEDFQEVPDLFLELLLFTDTVEISESNKQVLIYIAGYVARNSAKSCTKCKCILALSKSLDYEASNDVKSYLSALDRGGLWWPTELTMNICVTVYKIFQLCISKEFEEHYLKVKNQRHLLFELSKEKLEDQEVFSNDLCDCKKSNQYLVYKCIKIMSNILLNNYVKIRNDKLKKGLPKRKLSTLSK